MCNVIKRDLNMKSLKIWSLIALFAMALVGCGGDKEDGDNNVIKQTDIYGKWHLATMCGSAPEFDVYIEFSKDGTFDIYQQVWSFTYEHFSGNFTLNGNVVSGTYSDGSEWTASYEYAVSNSKLSLTNTGNSDEVAIYDACKIPAEVIEEATTATRSEGVVPFL